MSNTFYRALGYGDKVTLSNKYVNEPVFATVVDVDEDSITVETNTGDICVFRDYEDTSTNGEYTIIG